MPTSNIPFQCLAFYKARSSQPTAICKHLQSIDLFCTSGEMNEHQGGIKDTVVVGADGDRQDHFAPAGSNHREPGPQGQDLRAQGGSGLTTAPGNGGLGRVFALLDAAAPLAAGAGPVGSVHHSGGSSSSHGAGARRLVPEELGGPIDTASPAAHFAPPARERNPVNKVVVPAQRAVRRHRARGAVAPAPASARPPAALLAMLLGAMVIVGEPEGAPWPCQFGAFLIWLAGCISLFLSS